MQIVEFTPTSSRNVLLSMVIAALLLAGIGYVNRELLFSIYFDDQITATGLILNSIIVALFMIGILRVIIELGYYHRQERAIHSFIENCAVNAEKAILGVDPDTLVAQRYITLESLFRRASPINHAALAQLLVAEQSSRTNLIKFIHNILILAGVFGTIVSLSIALLGASDLLSSAESLEGMNQVVHGMSTALSTTITAITTYLLLGYFSLRLSNVQTHVVATIESITVNQLLPRFQLKTENIASQVLHLVKSLQDVTEGLRNAQAAQEAFEDTTERHLQRHEQSNKELKAQLEAMSDLLKRGFRLHDKS